MTDGDELHGRGDATGARAVRASHVGSTTVWIDRDWKEEIDAALASIGEYVAPDGTRHRLSRTALMRLAWRFFWPQTRQ